MELRSQGCKPVTSTSTCPTMTYVRIPHKQPTQPRPPDATQEVPGPPSWVDTANQGLGRRYADRPDSEDLLGPLSSSANYATSTEHGAIAWTIRGQVSRLSKQM
jgi:hypothetical protein